jgi:HK97 family phage major capsid protein
MKHVRKEALARAMELKGDNDDPAGIVTKALEDFQKSLDERLKEIEEKGGDPAKFMDRLDKLEARLNRPGNGGDNSDDVSAERKAFADYLRHGDRSHELKTLRVASDPQGGYLAPDEMSQEMIRNLVEFSPIRALASVRTTLAGAVSYPKRTGITNATWVGETQERDDSEPTFGQATVNIRELATYVDISNRLLQDSMPSAEAEVRLALAEDFGKKEGAAFLKGEGVVDPEGLMTASGVSHTATGNASTLGSAPADMLISVMYALPAAYRARGTWLMNGSTLAAIRKLKDSVTGAYIWQPSLALGQPETILGRPVVEVVDMDDVGTAAEPILFGDIASAYRIVDRVAMSILVNPYTRATEGITRIHATRRTGGLVIRPEAIRKVRCATT